MAYVSSIPDEVLVSEIFMKLAASCVVKLRSVCTSWRRLTTEPSFVRAHTRRIQCHGVSAAAEPIVYQVPKDGAKICLVKLDATGDTNIVSTFEVTTMPGLSGSTLRLLASCDGLLCFQAGDRAYYVCNPVTGIWTTVAAASTHMSYDRFLCGFYFHRPTEEYRLLHYSSNVVRERPRPLLWLVGNYEVVATVGREDKSWRSIGEFRLNLRFGHPAEDLDDAMALGVSGLREPGSVQVNGNLHWLHCVPAADRLGIIVFDTECEKFSRMPAPNSIRLRDGLHGLMSRICKIHGNLCLGWIRKKRMELWMLKDYATHEWAKLHTIQRHGFVKTVGCHDEEDGEMLVRWGTDSFGLYNFKLKTHNRVKITSAANDSIYYTERSHHLIYYTESLVDPRVLSLSSLDRQMLR